MTPEQGDTVRDLFRRLCSDVEAAEIGGALVRGGVAPPTTLRGSAPGSVYTEWRFAGRLEVAQLGVEAVINRGNVFWAQFYAPGTGWMEGTPHATAVAAVTEVLRVLEAWGY